MFEGIRIVRWGRLPARIPYRVIRGVYDLRITGTGIIVLPKDNTIGHDKQEKNVYLYTDVRSMRVKDERGWFILSISFWKGEHHWWNARRIGGLVLNEKQFKELNAILLDISLLGGKLHFPRPPFQKPPLPDAEAFIEELREPRV